MHLWLNHGDVWQKPVQYCKVIILQLKKLKKNVKKPVMKYHIFYDSVYVNYPF